MSALTASDRKGLFAELAAADQRLAAAGIVRHSLAPERDSATTLAQLGERFLGEDTQLQASLAAPFARGLIALADAVVENFPENIFWDIDFLAASLHGDALRGGRQAMNWLDECLDLVVDLHELFGQHSPIRFRYIHDFVYGYDWAKWVAKDPAQRAGIGPFDVAFLRALEKRGGELIQLIADNDKKYHQLKSGVAYRNPFGFSREPGAEEKLFRDLQSRDLVPVAAWDAAASPRWDRPYYALRDERAGALGLS